MVALSSCSLITTSEDAFTVEKDDCITNIDMEKSDTDIVVPKKVENKGIRNIEPSSSYFPKIYSIDLSKVSELEKFDLDISYVGKKSKLKKLDFSKNENLTTIKVRDTNALEEIVLIKTVSLLPWYIQI